VAAQNLCLTNKEAGRFVVATFGDTLNGYNSEKLAKFLDGSSAQFEGLFNHRAADVFAALGITTLVTLEALAQLKTLFETQRVAEVDMQALTPAG
jgi:hypothetical protein